MSGPADKSSSAAPDLLAGSVPKTMLKLGQQSILAFLLWESSELLACISLAQISMEQLAAFGYVLPIMLFVWGFVGLATAGALRPMLTDADDEEFGPLFVKAFISFTVFTFLVSGVWWAARIPLLRAIGAEGEILAISLECLELYIIIYPLVVMSTIGPEWMAQRGAVSAIAKHVVLASIMVAVGYPLFILGVGPIPQFGLTGLVVAIAAGRVYMLVSFLVVAQRMGWWRRPANGWLSGVGEFVRDARKEILPVTFLHQFLGGSALIIFARFMSEFGPEAMAAFIVGNRLAVVAMAVPMALLVGYAPLLARAWKAALPGRVEEIFLWGQRYALFSAVVSLVFVVAVAPLTVDLFVSSDDPQLRSIVTLAVICVPMIWAIEPLRGPSNLLFKQLSRRQLLVFFSLLELVASVSGALIGYALVGTLLAVFIGYAAGSALVAVLLWVTARKTLAKALVELRPGTAGSLSTSSR